MRTVFFNTLCNTLVWGRQRGVQARHADAHTLGLRAVEEILLGGGWGKYREGMPFHGPMQFKLPDVAGRGQQRWGSPPFFRSRHPLPFSDSLALWQATFRLPPVPLMLPLSSPPATTTTHREATFCLASLCA